MCLFECETVLVEISLLGPRFSLTRTPAIKSWRSTEIYSVLGLLDHHNGVDDGPDPANEDSGKEELGNTDAVDIASAWAHSAAGGEHGSPTWPEDVDDKEDDGNDHRSLDDGGLAAALLRLLGGGLLVDDNNGSRGCDHLDWLGGLCLHDLFEISLKVIKNK